MIYGYARVSTDGQSVAAQVTTLTDAGAEKVFREVASGAKTDRAQLRRVIDALGPGDVLMVTRLDPRSSQHACDDHRQASWIPFARRHMGRHHDAARPPYVDGARRLSGIRTRFDPRPHRRRPRPRQGERRQTRPQ